MKPAVRRVARIARPLVQASDAARRRPRLTVLGWHRIDDSGTELSTPVSVFEQQLDVLGRSGANMLPLTDAVRSLAVGDLPPRAVALTFDDGYASITRTAWPLLRERGLPATLFVVTGYLAAPRPFPWDSAERGDHTLLASADEIAAAARTGLDIGSHTTSHPWLPHLSDAELTAELGDSRTDLEKRFDRPVHSIAYPTGGWDRRVRGAAARAGYFVGVTVDRGTNGPNADRLALRRSFAPPSVEDFELMLAGAYTWLRPVDQWRMRKGVAC